MKRFVVACGCPSLAIAFWTGVVFGVVAGNRVAQAETPVLTQKPEIASTAADAPDRFHLLPGFQVERLFTVPKETHGSWISMTIDPQGRIIAASEGNAELFRLTPPPIGSSEPTRVESLGVHLHSPMGLLFAFDSLYVTVNGGGSGLYRLRDTDGDDRFDQVVKLTGLPGEGEHGPHALRLSPDGKQIYLIAGNHTLPPMAVTADPPQRMGGVRTGQRHATLPAGDSSRLSPNWDEDLLLPRQWDAGGHAVGILAPGGWIAATDPEGQHWELHTAGFRNAFDMALNADGEIIAYDADMEWDVGLPWYKPTRILHAVSGADFGWRSGTGKWPAYRVDSLPAVVNMGPGSPVGVEFGYGAKFPAKYQRALFALDWSYGTIYAVTLTAAGASYTGTKEEFLSRSPLPLTDVGVGPDGALYFTTGGRGTQSELYRVIYVGGESTAPVDARNTQFADLRALRQKLETLPVPGDKSAGAAHELVAHLAHADRHIRHAARVSLERIPPAVWQNAVLSAAEPDTLIGGVVALAHVVDSPAQPALLAALERLDFGRLPARQQLDYLRALGLAFIRLGAPEPAVAARLATSLDRFYPATTASHPDAAERDTLNRELCDMLVFLKSPTVVAKTVALLKAPPQSTPAADAHLAELVARNPNTGKAIVESLKNPPDAQGIAYVFSLRNVRDGWTPQERVFYFTWLRDQHQKQGGHSFQKFLDNIERDAYDNASDADRLIVDSAGLHTPYKAPELPAPAGPGQDYSLDALVSLSAGKPQGRDFAAGKKAFAAARCIVCHRFDGDGGATGPDLTQAAGRFTLRDLAESIVDPGKVVSDQYRATIVQTESGQNIVGRVIGETGEAITLLVDPEDSTKWIQIPKSEIESRTLSPNSLMPKNLLNTLNPHEVLDLLAYVLSRGNPQDPLFSK